jgi:plastocyanin
VRLNTADHMRPWRVSTLPLLVLVAGVLTLSGCGGSKGTSSSASTTTPANTAQSTSTTSSPSTALSLEANPEGQLKYETKSLTAKAGTVSIDFTNMSSVGHNVSVENEAQSVLGATPTFSGGHKTLTLNLKPGTYTFFCSVPEHRQTGMEGTLIVK